MRYTKPLESFKDLQDDNLGRMNKEWNFAQQGYHHILNTPPHPDILIEVFFTILIRIFSPPTPT